MENTENEWILDLPLIKQGTSLGITIPRKVLNELNLTHGDKVRVILYRKKESE